MTPIKARTPTGGEYSFPTLEEFVAAIEQGRIKADWQVFHAAAGHWLPVTAHPAFAQALLRAPENKPPRRSSELTLIYPGQNRGKPASDSDPLPGAPTPPPQVVAPAQIERVLGRRYSQPNSTAGDRAWSTAIRRPSGPRAPLVTMLPAERSSVTVVMERVVILGIILALIGMAINASRTRRSADANAQPAQVAQPEHQPR